MIVPYLTADLTGTGGVLRVTDADFEVDEVPAYPPAGHGDHVFVRVEKRGLTTPAVVEQLARALGVAPRDVGVAGLKDRRAVTRQWLSLPPPVTPEAVRAVTLPDVTILEVARHPHKLRTGHVRANRFRLVVREVGPEAAARARAILDRLAAPPGAPNWFGEQRFGRAGDNAARGRAILDGARPPRDRRLARLLVSAAQSELFNTWLAARMADGLYAEVIAGDLLHKLGRPPEAAEADAAREPDAAATAREPEADAAREPEAAAAREPEADAAREPDAAAPTARGGGQFACDDPATDQLRLAAGELQITGPMFGERMRRPPEGTPAAAREDAILAAAGLTREALSRVRALAEGTRRDAAIQVAGARVEPAGDGAIAVSFTLPGGAYATAVMREVMKTELPPPDRAAGPEDASAAAASGAPEP